jgi:hypothetical protein
MHQNRLHFFHAQGQSQESEKKTCAKASRSSIRQFCFRSSRDTFIQIVWIAPESFEILTATIVDDVVETNICGL